MGVAFAGNPLTLFLCYEVLTVSTYPLVAHKGDSATVKSARVYLGILMGASIALFLPAIIWTYHVAGTGDFTVGGILAGKIAAALQGIVTIDRSNKLGRQSAALPPFLSRLSAYR